MKICDNIAIFVLLCVVMRCVRVCLQALFLGANFFLYIAVMSLYFPLFSMLFSPYDTKLSVLYEYVKIICVSSLF